VGEVCREVQVLSFIPSFSWGRRKENYNA